MRVVFTKRAERNYQDIKNIITTKFGFRVANEFEKRVAHFLNILKDFPELGMLEVPNKQIFGFQLSHQTRIFYRIKNEQIIILTLFDVRQNPDKKPKS